MTPTLSKNMSRGYGKNQRAVLEYFARHPDARSPIIEITGVMLEKNLISASEYESFRRATNSLLVAGELKKIPFKMHYGDYHYCTPNTYQALKSYS